MCKWSFSLRYTSEFTGIYVLDDRYSDWEEICVILIFTYVIAKDYE